MAVIAQVPYRELAADCSMFSRGSVIRYALDVLLGKC